MSTLKKLIPFLGFAVSPTIDAQSIETKTPDSVGTSIEMAAPVGSFVSELSGKTMGMVDSVSLLSDAMNQENTANDTLPVVKKIEDIPQLQKKALEMIYDQAETFSQSADSADQKTITLDIKMAENELNRRIEMLKEAFAENDEEYIQNCLKYIARFVNKDFKTLLGQ